MFPVWGRLPLLPQPLSRQVQLSAPELVVFGTRIPSKNGHFTIFSSASLSLTGII